MNVFTLENLTLDEIKLLRQSLNIIDIKGSSAIFVATLQSKIDRDIMEIESFINEEAKSKAKGLEQIVKKQLTESK